MVDLYQISQRYPFAPGDLDSVAPVIDFEQIALERFVDAVIASGRARQVTMAQLVSDYQALRMNALRPWLPPPSNE